MAVDWCFGASGAWCLLPATSAPRSLPGTLPSVPRSPRVRLLALVLFVLAGFAEPAWELTHALTHLHGEHERSSQAVPMVQADGSSLADLGQDHGHDHPALEPALRPPADLFALGPALPSSVFRVSPMLTISRAISPFASNTRAGPDPAYTSQSRAPPTL